ncbi:MAG TPA: universal stress protein [Myxococcaceae bacterium]|nr:universal stress protein [Myxococcaceae bacterium]
MFQRALLAYDGSEAAKKALERCVEILPIGSAALHVVAVGRVPEYAETQDEVEEAREQAEAFYRKRLEEALAFLKSRSVAATTHVAYGKPSEQILRAAEEVQADLIVLGAHAHHPVRRRLLGGTADKIVDHAECSVLVVR